MIKNACILLTTLFITAAAEGQSRLSIKAPDSLAFHLKINDVQITAMAIVEITINDLQSAKTAVQLSVPRRPDITVAQELNLKPGGSYYYELARVKGKYKLQLLSESIVSTSDAKPDRKNYVQANESSEETESTLPEPLPSDSLVQELPAGKCAAPATTVQMESLKTTLKSQPLDARKLETMKNFVGQQCVRADQLRYMMAQLSTEDHKIRLLESARGQVFDPQHLVKLEEDFFLKKNKQRVKEIIASY